MGGYDEVHPVAGDASTVDWVYVTDTVEIARRSEALGWRAVVLDEPEESAFLRARRPKVAPHRFTTRSSSVYVDARFAVETERVVDVLSGHLAGDGWLGLFRHPRRDSIYDEAEECLRLRLGGPLVRTQVEAYRAAGVPQDTGLWCGGVIVRRHGVEQERFGEAWFEELTRWPTRDQLSLPVVLERCQIDPASIAGSVYSWPGLRVTPHLVARPQPDRIERYRRHALNRWSRFRIGRRSR
jgi:hypothetical protein